MLDFIKNVIGLIDTPIGRRKFGKNPFYEEIVENGRNILFNIENNNVVVLKIETGTLLPKFDFSKAVVYNDDNNGIIIVTADNFEAACNHVVDNNKFEKITVGTYMYHA
jgi:hypothetical protein